MISFRGTAAMLAALGLLAGCASTPKQNVVLTGNILVDGPNAVANGPPRDRVLWQYRTAAAAMRQGNFNLAKQSLDDALTSVQGVFGSDKNARKARGYFHSESKKAFIGEPYERSMAYIYRGILYWQDGQPDNARACFRSAQFEDSDTQSKEFAGDWVLPEYLEGLATLKLGGDGSDAFKRATQIAKGVSLPPYNKNANVLLFLEFGSGPTKYATGEYRQELRFTAPSPVTHSARFRVASLDVPVAPTDDVVFQATSRGGRVMDHILGNKAVFKSTTDTVGDVALVGGLGTALLSHDQTAQQVGLGLALAGVISKAISAAATPTADTRAWDNLPHYLSFAAFSLPPGKHSLAVEFMDAGGRVMTSKTKQVTVDIASTDVDKVIFVSDNSTTPQTL